MGNPRIHFIAMILLSGWACAAIIQVPSEVTTIQEAVNLAVNGDTIVVAEGVYSEFLLMQGKDITVTGSNPDDWGVVSRTIVQLPVGFTGSVVRFNGAESSACVLAGLTIQKGQDGGIRGSNTQATISRCWVRNNYGSNCGGIWGVIGLIDRCRITGNSAGTSGNTGAVGGLNGCGDISNCLIADNASSGAGGLSYCAGVISNCLIINNRSMAAASGIAYTSGTIIHCTIANNSSTVGSYGIIYLEPQTITNCIIWGNRAVDANGSPVIRDVHSACTPTYSCYSTATGADGNINSDPQLSPGFSLKAGSPCIDAGTDAVVPLAALDYRGGPRVVDGNGDLSAVTDMGAIEFDPAGISLVADPERLDFGGAGGVATFPVKTFELYNLEGYAGNWQFDTAGAVWLTVEPASGSISQTAQTISVRVNPAGLAEGKYTCNLGVVVDGTTKLFVPIVLHVGKVIRVPQDVAKIQPAIVQAVDWDMILVSPGEYKENLDFLGKKIYLRSVDPQDWDTVKTTIVNGRCQGTCVTLNKGEGLDSIVEGLTIQLGSGSTVLIGGYSYPYIGGGVLCVDSSPTIRRCQICWNGYISYTPGVFPPNPVPSGNSQRGGGIGLIGDCRAQIEDCLLIQNSASSRGAAIYANTVAGREHLARSIVERCTIADNLTFNSNLNMSDFKVDGSITQLQIRNTILWDSVQVFNTDQIQFSCSGQIYQYSGPTYGTRVEIAGKNDITVNPLFVMRCNSTNTTAYDYRLKADSLCINRGDPAFAGEGQTDLAGTSRVLAGRLDMGAFEFVPEIKVVHPAEGDVWAAGSRHPIIWEQPNLNRVVVSNGGFELSHFDAYSTTDWVTTKDEEVSGWTIGPNSGVFYYPEQFDGMPNPQSKPAGFDRGSGVYQLLVDSYRPNSRYTLKLFVGSRKDMVPLTNWQAALTAGDRNTILASIAQDQLGLPGLGKWIEVSLVFETGTEGVDVNVGKRIGILLTGTPRVILDEVSLEVAELNPTAMVDVELSTDDGQTWQTIADDVADTGSYLWTIPSDIASETCRVRAVSSWPDFIWVPSGVFAIRPYAPGEPVVSRWPTEGRDMQRTGLTRENGPELGCAKWQYNADSPMVSGPAIGPDERIFVGSEDGKLVALNTAGLAIWSYSLAAPLTGGITLGLDGTAYVGDRAGVLYAIDPAGQLRWKHQTKGMIASAPAVTADGGVIFNSVDGTVVALGADGSELWTFAIPGPGKVGGAAIASPTIGRDGNAYVGGLYNGKLYALDPADGHIAWTCDFGGGTANQHRSLANAVAVATDGTIYATMLNDTNLFALDPDDGTIAWTTNLAGSAGGDYSTDYPTRYTEVYPWATPSIGPDGTIYLAFDDPYLRAVNPDGTIRWVTRLGMVGGFIVSVGADGKIYAAGDDLSLYVVDSDGAILSRFDGSNWLSWPVIGADGTFYVSDFAGILWAIAPQPCEGKPQRLGRLTDITLDGKVRLEDLAELAATWRQCFDYVEPCRGSTGGWKFTPHATVYLKGDVDRDHWVGLSDLLAMAERWLAE